MMGSEWKVTEVKRIEWNLTEKREVNGSLQR